IGQPRIDTVIDRHFLANGQIELLLNQGSGNVPPKFDVSAKIRIRSFSPAFVRLSKPVSHADCERWIGIEFEKIEMVVVNDDDLIRRHGLERGFDGPCPVKPYLPGRAESFAHAALEFGSHRRGVRYANPTDNPAHTRSRDSILLLH